MKRKEEEFMALDELDFKILLMLIRGSEEFPRLDFADQKVLVWFPGHSPGRLRKKQVEEIVQGGWLYYIKKGLV